MELLAFVAAFLLCLIVLLMTSLYIDFNLHYEKAETSIILKVKTFYSVFKIRINIPRAMLSSGIDNILDNITRDASDRGVDADRKKNKSRRYLFLKHFSGEVYRKYLSTWPKFLYIKTRLTQLKKFFYKKIKIYAINFQLQLGGRDAAETGILVGSIWAFLGRMNASIYSKVTVKENNIRYSVIPRFDEEILISRINCILRLKISHIIFTALKLLIVIIKIRRIRK